jgi:hypothetical protein
MEKMPMESEQNKIVEALKTAIENDNDKISSVILRMTYP